MCIRDSRVIVAEGCQQGEDRIYELELFNRIKDVYKRQLPTVPSSSKTLSVSYVGMTPQTVTITQGVIKVVLKLSLIHIYPTGEISATGLPQRETGHRTPGHKPRPQRRRHHLTQ